MSARVSIHVDHRATIEAEANYQRPTGSAVVTIRCGDAVAFFFEPSQAPAFAAALEAAAKQLRAVVPSLPELPAETVDISKLFAGVEVPS
jgi:hypothetical protein